MWYINSVIVLNSALKHGIAPEDSIHAIRCAIVVLDLQEDPHKTLYLGLDRSGLPLEVVVMQTSKGDAIIHAMRMRTKYVTLIEGGKR